MVYRPVRERSRRLHRARRARGPRVHRLRRGVAHLALHDRPQPARGGPAAPVEEARRNRRVGIAAVASRRRVRRGDGSARLGGRQEERAHLRARGRDPAHARRREQERDRGGPARQRATGVRGRMATRQALLHDRASDRDRRRRRRHRRAGDARACGRQGSRRRPTRAVRSASRSPSRRSCPRRTRRSSGRRRSPSKRSGGDRRCSGSRSRARAWNSTGTTRTSRSSRVSWRAAAARWPTSIETAWRAGARFDAWSECFRLQTWLDAFAENGVDPASDRQPCPLRTTRRCRGITCRPAWTARYLASERERALDGECDPRLQLRRVHGLRGLRRPRRRHPSGGCIAWLAASSGSGSAIARPAGCAGSRTSSFFTRSSARSGARGSPYAVTQGFNPHMKVAFGPALPVGTAGENEYYDVWLTRYTDASEVLSALRDVDSARSRTVGCPVRSGRRAFVGRRRHDCGLPCRGDRRGVVSQSGADGA